MYIPTNVHTATCVLPTLLWLVSVAARWGEQAAAAQGRGQLAKGGAMLSWRQVVGLFLIVPLHCKMQVRKRIYFSLLASYGSMNACA